MAVQHRNIPDAERHEPKGISTATVDQIYVANGAASGVWKEIPYSINAVLDDVSTASFVLIPIPINVKIQSIRFTLANAITLANSTITVTRSDAAAMGNTVIPFTASAEGTTVDLIPSGNDVITAATHKYIKVATDGASTTASKLFISLKVKAV
jgi:hypothetical protein